MKFDGIIAGLKCMVICLLFIVVDKADDYESSSMTDCRVSTEIMSFSAAENHGQVPRNTNFSLSLQTFAKAHRQNSSNQSRQGFTLIKAGKATNEGTTSLFISSILNFPSGLNESSHHLISLRKLII